MSCVPIPDPHRQILDLLRAGPRRQADLEQTTGRDLAGPVDELRRWGWVFGDLELSGVGWYHAGVSPGGIRVRRCRDLGYLPPTTKGKARS